jgi:C4-dicarboxylate-specific signal transduction histidine kinase
MNKQEQDLLQQQAKMAAMGEMIGNIAHQWRQPLNALSALNVGLNMKYKMGRLNDEEMLKFKEKSNEIIQNMSATIDDFKNFFQPNKVKNTFEISAAISSALKFVSDAYHQHNIELQFCVSQKITINSYKNELIQVLLNILNNSKDAIVEKKVINPYVRILTKEDETHVTILIQDNAGGASEEVLERMYEPYFTTKFKSHGTGIGLYMSKMIIEESMNGILSSKNKGEGLLSIISIQKDTKDWSYSI